MDIQEEVELQPNRGVAKKAQSIVKMKVDTGLRDGVQALRQNEQLLDFTVKVDDREFRVHKVVLASVSDYFHAKLCGLPKDGKCNILELKEVSVKQACRLLDFIYTGDPTVTGNYQEEMLKCAVDFKVNTELQAGIAALRPNNQLSDLTLRVDGHEFKVHRVVLASVSDYFRAMLCGSLKESGSDVVELKGISARQVSRFLDFIYTGDNNVIGSNPKEMLECGVYFQVPKIIQHCTEQLVKSLRVRNCLDLLSVFEKFPVDDTAQMIIKFIQANLRKVIDHYKPEEMTLEIVRVALQNWKKSEWELFNFLNSWIAADLGNREEYRNDFLGQVRFKLMPPEEICAVKETAVYTNVNSPWKPLVDEASVYHHLPFHQKVLDKSIQNRARHSKSVFVMDTLGVSGAHILCKPDKASGLQGWKSCPDVKPPPVGDQFWFVMEVNNFLVACSEADHATQHWLIFDPRTLMWHQMAPMPRPRDSFAAVYHKKYIYVLGGTRFDPEPNDTDSIEEYSFETGMWSSTKKIPALVSAHAACVFKEGIYISGGRIDTPPFQTPRMDRLDLASQKWESKAPMLQLPGGLRRTCDHHMFVMKIKMKESIVVIFRGLSLDYYDSDTDQWSHCNFSVPTIQSSPKVRDRALKPVESLGHNSTGVMVAHGNTLFLLNMRGHLHNDHKGLEFCLCVKWIIPEEKDKSDIVQIRLRDDPMREQKGSEWFQIIWGMVAFPPQSAKKDATITPV